MKIERQDWTSFRTVEGLQQKAGVPATKLRRLVLKELADNALDAGGSVLLHELASGGYSIEDDGPGTLRRDQGCGSEGGAQGAPPGTKEGMSKDVVLDNLDDAIAAQGASASTSGHTSRRKSMAAKSSDKSMR